MLKSFGGLTQQMFEKPFKKMLYSIYNFAEEEFYIHGLNALGFDSDIDNLEYMSLDTSNVSRNEIFVFKDYIENELQHNNVIIGVLLYNKGNNRGLIPIVIKPKSVDIEDVLKER